MLKNNLITFFLSIHVVLTISGCERRDPEAEKRAAVTDMVTKLRSCAPAAQPEGNLKLAISSVTRNTNETSVRLVAYAIDESTDFDLPVYSMSRGRWLIDEKARAYLIDEQCREYKLNDRKSSSEKPIPQDGKIRLDPGQAFEATLSFPPLPEKTRMGILVYGGRTLAFSLWSQ